MKISVKVDINPKTIQDLIITALEGGSNYWYMLDGSQIDTLRKKLPEGKAISELIAETITKKGTFLRVYDCENSEHLGTLDSLQVKKGIAKVAQERPDILRVLLFDDADYDATDADVFFQYLVMGEIVYG